jgi:hypothetical protein
MKAAFAEGIPTYFVLRNSVQIPQQGRAPAVA